MVEVMSMSSAAAKLGSLVKGTFEGITITRTRRLPAGRDGIRAGQRWQHERDRRRSPGHLWLMSTYMSFSTISTNAAPRDARGSRRQFEAARSIGGSVSPAASGATIEIQQLAAGQWRTVTAARLGGGGRYSARLAFPGRYRVVYRGLDGPAVSVG